MCTFLEIFCPQIITAATPQNFRAVAQGLTYTFVCTRIYVRGNDVDICFSESKHSADNVSKNMPVSMSKRRLGAVTETHASEVKVVNIDTDDTTLEDSRKCRRRWQRRLWRHRISLLLVTCLLLVCFLQYHRLSSHTAQYSSVNHRNHEDVQDVDATKSNKKNAGFQPGDHVWVKSELSGATLLQRAGDRSSVWSIKLDHQSTVLDHISELESDGSPNIVVFMSSRQRKMKARLQQLLQVEKDAAAAKKAKKKERANVKKMRVKTRQAESKQKARQKVIARKEKKKDREREKRINDRKKEKLRAYAKRNRTREKMAIVRRAKKSRARQKQKQLIKAVLQRNKTRAARKRLNQRLRRQQMRNNSVVIERRKNKTRAKRIRERKRLRLKNLREQQKANLGELLPSQSLFYAYGKELESSDLIMDLLLGGLIEEDDALIDDYYDYNYYYDYEINELLLDLTQDIESLAGDAYSYDYYNTDQLFDMDYIDDLGNIHNSYYNEDEMVQNNAYDPVAVLSNGHPLIDGLNANDEVPLIPSIGEQRGKSAAALVRERSMKTNHKSSKTKNDKSGGRKREDASHNAWLKSIKRGIHSARDRDGKEPVNILMLYTDDVGFDAYHALENVLPDEELPAFALRKLARDGVQFREASTHISSSLPSRAALFTGCSAYSSGFDDARQLNGRSTTKTQESCHSLITTLANLRYDTFVVDPVAKVLFAQQEDMPVTTKENEVESAQPTIRTRKQLRTAINRDNRRYADWLLSMEPGLEDPNFLKVEETGGNNQLTGTITIDGRVHVPFAQMVEIPDDLLLAAARESCLPHVLDFAESRSKENEDKKSDNNEIPGDSLPPWALFGTTSLPRHLSRSSFVANQTVDALIRVAQKEARLRERGFAIMASFSDPLSPWLVPGQAYNSLMNHIENGVEEMPLNLVPLEIPVANKSGANDMSDRVLGPISPQERAMRKRVETFITRNPTRVKYLEALYYTRVKEINVAIETILQHLERLNLEDSTLVVFTSTGGTSLGRHGLLFRGSLFDESTHIPLIMKYPPLLARKQRSKMPVSSMDLAPTILDILSYGTSVDPHTGLTFAVDGISLVPVLKEYMRAQENNNDSPDSGIASLERATISTDGRSTFAIRTKTSKLIWDVARSHASWESIPSDAGKPLIDEGLPTGTVLDKNDAKSAPWQGAALYDIRNDPLETTNIISAPAASSEEVRDLLNTLFDFLGYIEFQTKRRTYRDEP